MLRPFLGVLILIAAVGHALADDAAPQAGTWPMEKLKNEVPKFRIVDDAGPIHSIIYEGLPIDGKPTEVFAFYASPKTINREPTALAAGPGDARADVDRPAASAVGSEKYPGIVLIHGGGGTAFSDWVWMWANRGYAAIAMDLSGRRPPAPKFDDSGIKTKEFNHPRGKRLRLEKGGLDQNHVEKFESIGGPIDDDWPYHAAANVIRAHTLLRSFPEVDADRTAVTGISWGGYTTCLVASLDDRFKAAVPVYGCGFLHEGESVQKPSIDKLGDRRAAWVAAYDPSSHLSKCTIPTFWVNGTHDNHYVLDSYAKSYSLVKGPKTFRIEPQMRHSHPAGWEPKEIGIYVDSILKGGVPLPTVGPLSITADGAVSANFSSKTTVTDAKLYYTTDTGLRSKRKWHNMPAAIQDGTIVAKGLPKNANTYLLTLTDQRGAMVTSEVGLR